MVISVNEINNLENRFEVEKEWRRTITIALYRFYEYVYCYIKERIFLVE